MTPAARALVVVFPLFITFIALFSAVAYADPEHNCARVPPNIRATGDLEPLVARLLVKSKTFRRQCEALVAARVRVTIVVTLGLRDALARARGTIARSGPRVLWAHIELPPAADLAELLPHEIEHVLEQIEGIDLAARVRAGHAGVLRTPEGAYETARARAAGLAAAVEVYGETDMAWGAAVRGVCRLWRAISARSAEPPAWAARIRAGTHKDF